MIRTAWRIAAVPVFLLLPFIIACSGQGLGEGRVRMTVDENAVPGAGYAIQSLSSPEAAVGDGVVCPVKGVKFTVSAGSSYAVIRGKKVYVFSPASIGALERRPEKYLDR